MKNKITLLLASVLFIFANESNAQRICVIEEFSSSTCPPCAGMNAWLDPLFSSNNANVIGSGLAVVKYQMNFPTPGTDASYNAMAQARANYYIAGMGSWGIPLHFTNGKYEDTVMSGPSMGASTQATVTSELASCKTGTPKVNVSATYRVKSLDATNDSIFITVTVTPTQTLTGTYYLIVNATQSYYQNTQASTGHTTSQTDFYHVMRKMYPSASGTAITNLTANTPQTFTFADKISVASTYPTQNSNAWWSNPYNGNVVAFVEDHTPTLRAQTRIMNGYAAPAKWTTDVNSVNSIQNIKVVPNPASSQAFVFFNVNHATKVMLNVTDMMGKIVYHTDPQTVDMNAQRIEIPTANLANGLYNVTIRSEDGGEMTQRLSVAK
ncbi:MAG: T9SS type A sorting domain-containing protein [Bacteroidetes bacterium]|nr:T9SS type A sorting domain-containing protein [Bacteroidota bacterium]